MTTREISEALAKKLGNAVHRREVLLEQLRRLERDIADAKADMLALEKVINSVPPEGEA